MSQSERGHSKGTGANIRRSIHPPTPDGRSQSGRWLERSPAALEATVKAEHTVIVRCLRHISCQARGGKSGFSGDFHFSPLRENKQIWYFRTPETGILGLQKLVFVGVENWFLLVPKTGISRASPPGGPS